jgi:hypothetical protein
MLIILTPHIVKGPEDAERVRQMEESRMNWCLCDVNQVHGPLGFGLKSEPQPAPVVYPDANPRGTLAPPVGPGGPPPSRDARPETVPLGPEMPGAKTSALAPIAPPALQRLPATDSAQLTNYQSPPREPFAIETCRGNTFTPPSEDRRWLQ